MDNDPPSVDLPVLPRNMGIYDATVWRRASLPASSSRADGVPAAW
jgi:hypothetical protein